MRVKRPGRLLAALGAAFVPLFTIALPAWAQPDDPPTVGLNPASAGMTAEEFPEKSCDAIPGGSSGNMDGWVFELPTSDAQLVAVLAAFRVGNGDPGDGQYQVAVISKPGFANPDATGAGRQYPSGIVTTGGTSKAWLQTPHDSRYELSYGEASLNGETVAKFFTITHTCPAGFTSSSAVVSAGNGGNVTTVATQDPDPGENEGASGGEPGAELGSTNSPTPDPENTGDGDGESESGSTSAPASPSVAAEAATQDMLPITGAAIGGMILGGLFMVLLGAVLVAVRRRRKSIQFQA